MKTRLAQDTPWRAAFERMTAVLPSLAPPRCLGDFLRDLGAAIVILADCFLVLVVVALIDIWLGLGLLEIDGRGWGSSFGALLSLPVILTLVTMVYMGLISLPASLLRLLRRITGA